MEIKLKNKLFWSALYQLSLLLWQCREYSPWPGLVEDQLIPKTELKHHLYLKMLF